MRPITFVKTIFKVDTECVSNRTFIRELCVVFN